MILILSGRSGSGKTSACAILEGLARASGAAVGGTLCRAVFEGGRKTGIDARDLSRGPEAASRPLARARPSSEPSPDEGRPRVPAYDDSDPLVLRYGMWEFDKPALSAADASSAAFITDASRGAGGQRSLAIIDEIGPLELDKRAGMVSTLDALDALRRFAGGGGGLGCVVVARPDIADRLAARWAGSARIDMEGSTFAGAAETAMATLGL
ncbi:MAG: hypothetical protein KKA67_07925 [Spirochaetes bacterium]|nr:hypothetical protein [Spirochaetota bacterium]